MLCCDAEKPGVSAGLTTARPVVMTFSGHDPGGGAGIQADIEALASVGCHAAPVVTALTVQDTRDVASVHPVDPGLVLDQARAVLADLPVAAFKIGLLGSAEVASALAGLLDAHPGLPLVLDPITAAGGGTPLAGERLVEAMRALLPRVTVVTPNTLEAARLAPDAPDVDARAEALLAAGCGHVLVTGTHDGEGAVCHRLYGRDGTREAWSWPRLPHVYHGSGCTLAAALAGQLARGAAPRDAALEAQASTWATLDHGTRPGHGQHLPARLYWAAPPRRFR